jgi:16S rRNA (uracil1498-N3)-methyltransferase
VGERFVAFDGKGHECVGEITEVKKKTLNLKACGKVEAIDRRPCRKIKVAVVFPKARARGMLMEKLVELGVHEVQALISQRGVEAPDNERLLAQAIAAMKQCGINHLPLIHPPMKLKKFLDQSEGAKETIVLLHPEGDKNTPSLDPITVMVGPEGGFSDEEIAMIPHSRWSLGNQVLRSETACMAAVARLSQ